MKKNKNSDARPGLYERVYEREADRRVSEAEAQALKLEAYERTAANRRNRSIARALLAFVIVILLIGALTYAVYRLLFVITEIEVSGNVSYSAEELISASGVSEGDNLYSFSSRVAGEKMKAVCPYVKSLSVKRSVPSRITFTVEEYTPEFFADIYGETFILAGDLTVLESTSETKPEGLCRLKLPAVASAVCGRSVEFCAESLTSQISGTCAAVISSELDGRIGVIDLRDRFSLTMECDGKYLLSFGTYDDCPTRLRVAAAVLKDEMFESANKAKLDLSNISETKVTVDNTLTFE